jgi:hypothetical protein
MQETYWLSDNLKQQIKNGADSTGLNTGGEWVKYFSEHGALCPKALLHETMGNREFYCFEGSTGEAPDGFWEFIEQLPKPTTEQQAKPYGDGSYEVVQTWGNTEQPHLVVWYTNGQWGGPAPTYFVAKEYVEQ